MSKVVRTTIFFFVIIGLLNCSEKDGITDNKAPVAIVTASEGLDRVVLDGRASFDPMGNQLIFKWTTSGNYPISDTSSSIAFIRLPASGAESAESITLNVFDGSQHAETTISVKLPVMTQSRAYGLGKIATKEVSNDVDYNWYIDQAGSGIFSNVNCGPASVTMAIKWTDKNFNLTAKDARDTYRSSGGWWFTTDIINYLNDKNVSNKIVSLRNMDVIADELDHERIVILCLDMSYVRPATITKPDYRRDKFYNADTRGWGHFVVLNGYKVVDSQRFFQAYDPHSYGASYSDTSLKGAGRYYTSEDLDGATQNWWDYAIVVGRTGAPLSGRVGINPEVIEHQSGQ